MPLKVGEYAAIIMHLRIFKTASLHIVVVEGLFTLLMVAQHQASNAVTFSAMLEEIGSVSLPINMEATETSPPIPSSAILT